MPDPGEGLAEAEIIAWRVAEGDRVQVNDILVEVETSKSLVELPSPFAGTVVRLLVAEGATVEVGTAIVEIEDGTPAAQDPAPDAEAPAERTANLVGYGPKAAATTRRRRRATSGAEEKPPIGLVFGADVPGHRTDQVIVHTPVRAEPLGAPLPEPGVPPTESGLVLAGGSGPELAKPPVRKYAKDLGVDLTKVTGTGPHGTITRGDVEAAAAFAALGPGRATGPTAPFAGRGPESGGTAPFGPGNAAGGPGGGERRVPIKGVRKVTAENMIRSQRTHVHVTEWVEVDVTATVDLVDQLKARREFAGLRISPLLVYAKAVCLALGRNPDLNASWDDEAAEIVYHGDVNLGIAAATPRGLMVPNIKAAQTLGLLDLCRAINQLVATSREGKLQPGDYAGGTFTITNVGIFGVDGGTPIINGDESAILCMGAINRRPWVVGSGPDERVEPRWVTTLSLSFDHRLIDGEQGSVFLHDVAEVLHQPSLALLF
ncbi:MAG: dihydrolipoamide acetyltransferase family protein [Propionibacteriaceae bacterium]|nr:dihydrolipoamide acetyltransferase family protein [Propionibacteriaceae bacterium]